MEVKELYREILNEHNMNPTHRRALESATLEMEGVNPSCGDKITLQVLIKDGKVLDAGFVGTGCAVSQASADMMIDLVLGKSAEEALRLSDIFTKMIRGEASDEEIEELDEAAALKDISHMPSRVKCALLGWRTMREMLFEKSDGSKIKEGKNAHAECGI